MYRGSQPRAAGIMYRGSQPRAAKGYAYIVPTAPPTRAAKRVCIYYAKCATPIYSGQASSRHYIWGLVSAYRPGKSTTGWGRGGGKLRLPCIKIPQPHTARPKKPTCYFSQMQPAIRHTLDHQRPNGYKQTSSAALPPPMAPPGLTRWLFDIRQLRRTWSA
jgi:hypothetical protein